MTSARFCCTAVALAMLALTGVGPLAAQDPPLCTHLPRYGWISLEEIEAKLREAGFKLLQLRITNQACYAAWVENATGLVFELRVHPASGDILYPGGDMQTGSIKRR